METCEQLQRKLAEFTNNALDDAEVWGKRADYEAITLFSEVTDFLSEQDAAIRLLDLRLEVARKRGDEYLRQAREANKKLEARRQS